MLNSRLGYSVKKNSFKGLNIDCIQYSNIIWITYYSYSYSGTILDPNIIRIRIRPNICAQILFVFVFADSENTYSYLVKILNPNNIRIRMRSKKQYSLTSDLSPQNVPWMIILRPLCCCPVCQGSFCQLGPDIHQPNMHGQ